MWMHLPVAKRKIISNWKRKIIIKQKIDDDKEDIKMITMKNNNDIKNILIFQFDDNSIDIWNIISI